MGDATFSASECVAGTVREAWGPTMGLRVKEQDDGRFLVEQLWQSSEGRRDWRKLPCVLKGEA